MPSAVGSKHDDVFDTKIFARKLRWRWYHKENGNVPETKDDVDNLEDAAENIMAPERLKPKGSSQPFQQNKQLESIISKLTEKVVKCEKTKPSTNLTHREVEGMKWCRKMVGERKIYHKSR